MKRIVNILFFFMTFSCMLLVSPSSQARVNVNLGFGVPVYPEPVYVEPYYPEPYYVRPYYYRYPRYYRYGNAVIVGKHYHRYHRIYVRPNVYYPY